jgi:hypothetical protein
MLRFKIIIRFINKNNLGTIVLCTISDNMECGMWVDV